MSSNVHHLGTTRRLRMRVFGLSIKAESKQAAAELERRLRSLAEKLRASANSEDKLYELSVDRTTIIIWAETPDSTANLLEQMASVDAKLPATERTVEYRITGRHVRYKTEPVLMEPVMWINLTVPGLYESNVMELIAGLTGQVTHQKEIAGGWCRIRAEAPLSELYDFSSRIHALCDSESTIDIGFSHYCDI